MQSHTGLGHQHRLQVKSSRQQRVLGIGIAQQNGQTRQLLRGGEQEGPEEGHHLGEPFAKDGAIHPGQPEGPLEPLETLHGSAELNPVARLLGKLALAREATEGRPGERTPVTTMKQTAAARQPQNIAKFQ